ncbi:unnamed protein product [Citrullus colocynthis]|uniref:Uncharacterized protein n=1 Tax=Citrullus colocynthis TaxID=252529 RepID=A0ABP0XTK9_9ROSI
MMYDNGLDPLLSGVGLLEELIHLSYVIHEHQKNPGGCNEILIRVVGIGNIYHIRKWVSGEREREALVLKSKGIKAVGFLLVGSKKKGTLFSRDNPTLLSLFNFRYMFFIIRSPSSGAGAGFRFREMSSPSSATTVAIAPLPELYLFLAPFNSSISSSMQ